MNLVKRLDHILARLEGWIIALLLSLMVVLTFFQVALRGLYTYAHLHWANVMLGQIDWSGPLARLLVLWLTFLGASLLTREGRHIKIDIFSTLLPKKWLPLRELVLTSACALISAIMLKVCIAYIDMEMEFGGSVFLNLPSWTTQIILPVGFALLLFRFLIRAVDRGIEILKGSAT